jgi:hypothetical protein
LDDNGLDFGFHFDMFGFHLAATMSRYPFHLFGLVAASVVFLITQRWSSVAHDLALLHATALASFLGSEEEYEDG